MRWLYYNIRFIFIVFFFLYCFRRINRYRSAVTVRFPVYRTRSLEPIPLFNRQSKTNKYHTFAHCAHKYQYGCPRSAQLPLGMYMYNIILCCPIVLSSSSIKHRRRRKVEKKKIHRITPHYVRMSLYSFKQYVLH